MFSFSLFLSKIASLLTFASVPNPGDPCTIAHHNFFIIPPWWEYLSGKYDQLMQCAPYVPGGSDFLGGTFLPIGLAVLDMLLRLAGFLAVVSIIISGVEYITATGNTDKITNARRRWINALTGLAIVLVATAAVSFIGRNLVE